jgi:hypothetical protein
MNRIFGNGRSWPDHGAHIGDLFNGLLSIVSASQKNDKNEEPIYFSAPKHRHEIINMFSYTNIEPSVEQNFIETHVNSTDEHLSVIAPIIHPSKREWISHDDYDINIWDYFSRFNLTSDDMFEDYFLEGGIIEDVTDKDIIILPISSETDIIHYDTYLEFIKNNISEYNNIYWNVEPKSDQRFNYRPNYPHVEERYILNSSIGDLINTIDKKNPIIIGHRSGIFDIIFHILKNTRVCCFYDMRDPIQRLWRFKSNSKNHQNFDKYIEERSQFHEIELNCEEDI